MPRDENDWPARSQSDHQITTTTNLREEYNQAGMEAAADLIQHVTGTDDRDKARFELVPDYNPNVDFEEIKQVGLERRTPANLAEQYEATDSHDALDELLDLVMDVTELKHHEHAEYLLSPGYQQHMQRHDD